MSRVLVVEDEPLLAMMVEQMLVELGHEVAASVSDFEQALRLAHADAFDLAILDVNLRGRRTFPVAEALKARGIPFIFATGYGSANLDYPFPAAPVLEKPFLVESLAKAIQSLAASKR